MREIAYQRVKWFTWIHAASENRCYNYANSEPEQLTILWNNIPKYTLTLSSLLFEKHSSKSLAVKCPGSWHVAIRLCKVLFFILPFTPRTLTVLRLSTSLDMSSWQLCSPTVHRWVLFFMTVTFFIYSFIQPSGLLLELIGSILTVVVMAVFSGYIREHWPAKH